MATNLDSMIASAIAACPHVLQARAPSSGTQIYKDECTQCFDGWDKDEGVDVCLTCFNSGCGGRHSLAHAFQAGHALAINLRRTPKPRREDGTPPPQKMTKLAIAAESDAEKYDVHTKVKCFECNIDEVPLTGNLAEIVNAVTTSSSASLQNEVKAWELEIEACEHTVCLEQAAAKALDASTAHCGQCDLRENLWLCLTCGHLGCGRQQFGGLPGNGHALVHATTEHGHAVAVKLGTITPEGGADVYCYACNEERTDPYLASHMAHFGVNIATVTKTEKSLVEMQIEQNLKFEFEMTSADGQQLEPIGGPGLIGLRNLGNSCYLASVMQCLVRIPEFVARYDEEAGGQAHATSCEKPHGECWECQWIKLVSAVRRGRPAIDAKAVAEANPAPVLPSIAPSQFKHLIGRGHKEFSGMKQQDASEFLVHVLKAVHQNEHRTGRDPSHVFNFTQTQVLRCGSCNGVRVADTDANVCNLMVPDAALKAALATANDETVPPTTVQATECLAGAMGETVEFHCPRCAKQVTGTKTTGFKTFPKYLALVAQRFTYDNWVPKKSSVRIAWPQGAAESLAPMDLGFLRVAIDPATTDVIEESAAAPAPAAAAAPQPDSEALLQLISFGVPRGKARRALRLTGGYDLEAALNWAMDQPEDVDEAEEDAIAGLPQKKSPPVDEGAVAMLADMGFTRPQAVRGLRETGGSLERAVEWLFSHPDVTGDEPAGEAAGGASDAPAAPAGERSDVAAEHPKYVLDAFVNHKGPSMLCGHYINHIALPGGKWVMMNDDRVVAQPAPVPLLEEAYVYVLRRVDDSE
ncbi:ubiquitin C-terminal hydrolase Ubp14 [Blastocladiella emersonii ATCC 22665]|nr:ubiquitin C-terminal hydrolase Ubp14 [Blastocladiella emersonii ATCC 22665]